MNKTSLAILMALVATPAFAQYRDYRSPNGIPVYQLGSGQRAGGPANELISPYGGPVAYNRYTGSRPPIPAYQLGSGQRAGGPANELISPHGDPAIRGQYMVGRPPIPAYQLGSGQRAGGPANELNNAGSIRYFRY